MPSERLSYRQFWPLYVAAHRRLAVQYTHMVATLVGAGCCTFGAIFDNVLWFPAGIALAYTIAFVSHFFVDRSRPTAFGHPLWSAVADVHMCALLITGARVETISQSSRGAASTIDETTTEASQ